MKTHYHNTLLALLKDIKPVHRATWKEMLKFVDESQCKKIIEMIKGNATIIPILNDIVQKKSIALSSLDYVAWKDVIASEINLLLKNKRGAYRFPWICIRTHG